MWQGQAKFYCTRCGKEVTDNIRKLIEDRCKSVSIDPIELGEKAREAINAEMLLELGDEPANPAEFAFIKATALMLLEFAYSDTLLCDECRSASSNETTGERVHLRLLKGGKTDR